MTAKHCYSCGRKGKTIANDADKCPACGGSAFYYGARMTRTLWPVLPAMGRDTMDESGNEVPGEWERQASRIQHPRWRR